MSIQVNKNFETKTMRSGSIIGNNDEIDIKSIVESNNPNG